MRIGWVVAFVSIAWGCAPSDAGESEWTPAPVCASEDCGEVASTPPLPPPPPSCTPRRCEDTDTRCGQHPDGCGGTLQCAPCPSRELCRDGADNDADGASDCEDTGCHADAACVTCGTCTGPQVCGGEFHPTCAECRLTADLGAQVPLVRHGDPHTYFVLGEVWSNPAPRVSYAPYDTFRWTAPRDGAYVFSHVGSGTQSVLFVRAGSCNGEPVPGASASYPHRYELKAGQAVYLSLFGDLGMYARWAMRLGYYRLSISSWVDNERGHCGDGFDNDGDGHLDCFDPDCAGAAACESGRCAQVDLGEQLPVVASRPSGLPQERLFAASCGAKPSHSYVWTAPKDGTFVIQTDRRGATLALWDSCGGPELACASGPNTGDSQTRLVRTLPRGKTVLISVEDAHQGHSSSDPITRLYIHEQAPEDTPDACRDGLDNDGDGGVDGWDEGCEP